MAEYTSPYDVPALADRYPVLRDIEGMQAASEHIHRGDPIDAATLLRAGQVVNSLKLRRCMYIEVSIIAFSYSNP